MTTTLATRDVAVVQIVRRACVATDGTDPLDEATGLTLKHRGLGATDHLLVSGREGFALALTDTVSSRVDLSLAVLPAARRQGLAGALLAECLSAEEYAAAEWFAWSHGNHPAAQRLAAIHDFVNVRELWVLRMKVEQAPTLEESPAPELGEPPPADSITIRPYQDSDAADLIAVNAAAFATHPEQGAMDAANLAQRMAEPWFDPLGLLVAIDGSDSLIGFHWTKLHPRLDPADPLLGEVYVIGVSPAAHGQGVGRSLMHAGLQHLAAQGARHVLLYVEADNSPALKLYASLGFTHDDRDTHVLFHRPARTTK